MLRVYLKTSWRSLLKNRLSSMINIGGLSVGMAVAMLIACWIRAEFSFDRQFANYPRIAQVWELYPDHQGAQTQLPSPVADELRAKFGSDYKRVVLSSMTREHVLDFGEKKVINKGNFIEPAGLEMFSIPIPSGLQDPHSILLSASLAKALFGRAEPVGNLLHLDDTILVKVTGVYPDFPYNSSFRDVAFLAPWDLYVTVDGETKRNRHSWGDNNWQTFVQLADNVDLDKASAKIKRVKADNDPFYDAHHHNINSMELFLHPMSRWHLYSGFRDEDRGRIRYVRLFGLIGIFVLLLACINFMNLSTARSERRAKEVGIRKTMGSPRSQLIGQFFTESLLVAAFGLIIALGLVQLSLPVFSELSDAKVTIPWSSPLWWVACMGFTLLTGLIAGSYPALYLSSFLPVKVLKGKLASNALPRKILVVLQFTVSIVMIIGTMIVFRQVQYARNRPVGYDQGGLVMVQTHTKDIYQHFQAFRADLRGTGAIIDVAQSVSPVTASWPFNGGLTWSDHKQSIPGDPDFAMKGVSPEYGKTVGLKYIQGEDFRQGSDSANALKMVLNEASLRYMGFRDPIGKTIIWQGYQFTVIGVVKDMVMESPYETPVPALFYVAPYSMSYLTIRINPRMGAQEALARLAPVFAKYNPSEPFDFKFVDLEYDAKFHEEIRIGQLAAFFTILAIIISCLGLFGLASFVAEQRTREIGIRKVLGATVFNLWKLLSQDFVLLICLSCLISTPIAWWFLHQWLEQFSYRMEISWWIFAVAGIGALVITVLTVSFQAIRAATANPVNSLRAE